MTVEYEATSDISQILNTPPKLPNNNLSFIRDELRARKPQARTIFKKMMPKIDITIAKRLEALSSKGDFRATELIAHYIWGKPDAKVDLTSDGGPISINNGIQLIWTDATLPKDPQSKEIGKVINDSGTVSPI